jgi:hypothetical protein
MAAACALKAAECLEQGNPDLGEKALYHIPHLVTRVFRELHR